MLEIEHQPNGHRFAIIKPESAVKDVLSCIREHSLLLRLMREDGKFAYVPITLIEDMVPRDGCLYYYDTLNLLVAASFLRHSDARFGIHPANRGYAITEQGEILLAQLQDGREKRIFIRDRRLFR